MDIAAVILAGASLVALGLVLRRLEAVRARVAAIAHGESGDLKETRSQVATLQHALQAQLAAMQHQVASEVGLTHAALSDVRERLGALQQQSREVAELARDVGTLQDLLRPPKLRGGIGELLLERLLEDLLPGRYERQFEFPSTRTRVDAVVRMGDKLVPIDAKFPLELFVELTRLSGDERRAKRRAFIAAVKRHVDEVARKYIVPADGTIDVAFMYVPAENVYYQLTITEADDDFDLRAYCAERRVLPVSPNTLQAFLAAVHLGLRGLAIEESAKEIQRYLGQIGQDLARLDAEHQKLGRHLDNARQVHDSATRWLGRVGERLRLASSSPIAELPAQPLLPLDGERES